MKKNNRLTPPHAHRVLAQVNQGFYAQGTDLPSYCEKQDLDKERTVSAVLGAWKNKKAVKRRAKVIQASKAGVRHV
jgi:hypothetical protein